MKILDTPYLLKFFIALSIRKIYQSSLHCPAWPHPHLSSFLFRLLQTNRFDPASLGLLVLRYTHHLHFLGLLQMISSLLGTISSLLCLKNSKLLALNTNHFFKTVSFSNYVNIYLIYHSSLVFITISILYFVYFWFLINGYFLQSDHIVRNHAWSMLSIGVGNSRQ